MAKCQIYFVDGTENVNRGVRSDEDDEEKRFVANLLSIMCEELEKLFNIFEIFLAKENNGLSFFIVCILRHFNASAAVDEFCFDAHCQWKT